MYREKEESLSRLFQTLRQTKFRWGGSRGGAVRVGSVGSGAVGAEAVGQYLF